jgi:hypothetical protein
MQTGKCDFAQLCEVHENQIEIRRTIRDIDERRNRANNGYVALIRRDAAEENDEV